MKIQCDLCDKGEASIFCVADEAAMCDACDHRVHHANNLAGNHHHFFLLPPSPKQLPLCDICQERRAFLFCQQDRVILCTECDIPIHKANKHKQKHNRFLLNGIKISPTSTLYSSSSSDQAAAPFSTNSISKVCNVVPSLSYQDVANKRENASTISDYLMDVIPGWHVEDLLDPFSPLCFSKDDDLVGGLQVMDKSDKFIAVNQWPGTLLVNLGHVAKVMAWSNGRFHNVKHRVVCKEAATGISIAPSFVFGPKDDKIEPPLQLVDSEHPRLYRSFTFEESRRIRLSRELHVGEVLDLLRVDS